MNQTELTKRIEQVVAEDVYSRKNIRKYIQEAIEQSVTEDLKPLFENYVQKVTDWMMTPGSYESIEREKQHIRSIEPNDIVIEIFVAVLPCTQPTPIQEVATKLLKILNFDDVFTGIKMAANLLGVCSDSKLYMVYGDPLRIKSNFELSDQIKQIIEKTQYLNPMLCPPNNWESNVGGGYITSCDSIVLKKYNRHNKPQALDALNTVQQIEWELDDVMVNYIEKPNTEPETKEQIEAATLLSNKSLNVYQEMMDTGNSFYFVWRYDFRGRMYSQGYYINLQSTSYKKAILNFKKKELIT